MPDAPVYDAIATGEVRPLRRSSFQLQDIPAALPTPLEERERTRLEAKREELWAKGLPEDKLEQREHQRELEEIDDELIRLPEPPEPEPEPEPEPVDPFADEAAALDEKLRALNERRATLAFDARTDTDARENLTQVEAEISEAHSEVERLDLARTEKGRRDVEAERENQRKTKATAERKLKKLSPARAEAASAVDAAAKGFAEAIAHHTELAEEEVKLVEEAGGTPEAARAVRPLPDRILGALVVATVDAPSGLHLGLSENLPPGPQLRRPLAVTDPCRSSDESN